MFLNAILLDYFSFLVEDITVMKYGTNITVNRPTPHTPIIRKNLTEGNIFVKLLLFALPILLTNTFQQLYNLADSIIVGQYVGKEALAGVGANNTIANLLLCLFMGLAAGGGVVVAQYYGAKDPDNVSKTVHTMVIVSVISGAVMSVVGYFLARPILALINSPADVIDYSTEYLQIYFLGAVFVMFYNNGAAILRAIGNSVMPLVYLLISAVVNVALNYVFVAICGYGIAGAAWATLIAQAVSAVMVLVNLIITKSPARLSFRKLKVTGFLFKKIIKQGVPIGLQSSMFSVANLILQANLGAFGSTVMAGWVAANKVDNLAYAPIQAFGIATNTFAGQNLGAKRYDRVRKGMYTGMLLAMCAAALTITPGLIFRESLIKVFNANPDVVSIGAKAMLYIMPFYTVFGLTEVMSGTLRGVGKSAVSATLAAIGILGVRIFWLYVIVPIWPTVDVLFFVHPISWFTNFLMFVVYYLIMGWKRILNLPDKNLLLSPKQLEERGITLSNLEEEFVSSNQEFDSATQTVATQLTEISEEKQNQEND